MYELFFWLAVGHAVADYPLQGDFLARGKNQTAPLPGFQWWVILTMHALIHAGAVMLITQSFRLGLLELLAHWLIDYTKSAGKISFLTDQALHILCKAIWVSIILL